MGGGSYHQLRSSGLLLGDTSLLEAVDSASHVMNLSSHAADFVIVVLERHILLAWRECMLGFVVNELELKEVARSCPTFDGKQHHLQDPRQLLSNVRVTGGHKESPIQKVERVSQQCREEVGVVREDLLLSHVGVC